MKNFEQNGDTITLTVTDDTDHADGRKSGDGVINGYLFGIAVTDIAAGKSGPCKTTGVFKVTKVGTQAWTVGEKIYFDDAANNFTSTQSSNKYVGLATAVVAGGAGDTTGHVRLNDYAQ